MVLLMTHLLWYSSRAVWPCVCVLQMLRVQRRTRRERGSDYQCFQSQKWIDIDTAF